MSPARIHVSVPLRFRTHRQVPHHIALHRADVPGHELDTVEGIPVTTLARAITDCARAHLGADLIAQAIDQGQDTGRLSRKVAARLKAELLPR